MVVVRWGVTFEKTGARLIEFDISYIVQETGIAPKIILLISHEDEGAVHEKIRVGTSTCIREMFFVFMLRHRYKFFKNIWGKKSTLFIIVIIHLYR
jgi:hypothetical protein